METNLLVDAIDLWQKGGALMIPLALLALFIYFTAFELYFRFSVGNYLKVKLDTLNEWVRDRSKAKGEIGEILEFTNEGTGTVDELSTRYAEVRSAHLARVDRRIVFLSILVSVAPLMGLLGTVMGMLATFEGLTKNVGRTIDLIAAGISEALITTQTGLVIAIPGYILIFIIIRRRNRLETVITRLESMSMQEMERTKGRATA
ncbi:MAG: MotA/TolQ/ExbB proton channel family protein [Verrucomicrobiota bacterium]